MSATKLGRAKRFVADRRDQRIEAEGADTLVRYHDHDASLIARVDAAIDKMLAEVKP